MVVSPKLLLQGLHGKQTAKLEIKKGRFIMSDKKENNRKMTSKQVVALVGVILLAAIYLITLIVAIFDQDSSGRLFQACLVATVAIPLLIWIYIWMYGKLSGKHTMADLDLGGNAAKDPDPLDKSDT